MNYERKGNEVTLIDNDKKKIIITANEIKELLILLYKENWEKE